MTKAGASTGKGFSRSEPPTEDLPAKDYFVHFNKIDELAPEYLEPYDFKWYEKVQVDYEYESASGCAETRYEFDWCSDYSP